MVAKFPTTRYQGSKQKFADWIWDCVKNIPFHSALDAFGGTGSVSFRLKKEGKQVTYNDILPFNHIIGKALIENTGTCLDSSEVDTLLKKDANIEYPNFIEHTFKDIYFTDEENHWLDVVSANIRRMNDPYKQAVAYFALFQSCIIKRPYNLFHRKNLYVRLQDVKRSFGNKKTWDTPFEVHFRKFVDEANNAVFDNGETCRSINQNAFNVEAAYDFVYIDTPYLNNNGIGVDYADFYHFLNGLVDYDNWATRIDYKSKHLRLLRQPNVWNEANSIHQAFELLFTKFQNSTMAISYRSNGIPTIEELVRILESLGKNVKIHQSSDIKYVLSTKQSNEILIVAS
ncbi:MAG: DNA adenine methylase [Bacteroidaceae bacterium]|nr:DNA adenine methylase [Bacteroidaceae bacterium]